MNGFKKTFACAVLALCLLAAMPSLGGCASVQQELNTWDTDMNGRVRDITVYTIEGNEIANFVCRCTIDHEEDKVLFDNLDTNERTVIYGKYLTVIAKDAVVENGQ